MKILLTDEEIETLEYEILHRYFPSQQFKGIRKSWEYDFLNSIAKAQLIKLIGYIDNKGGWTFPDDWDDIKKEVE